MPWRVQALNQTTDAEAVALLYRKVFGSEADEATKIKLAAHLAKMTGERGLSRQEALAVVAQSLLASNAFLHVF